MTQTKHSIFYKRGRFLFGLLAGTAFTAAGMAQEMVKADVQTSLAETIAKRRSVRQYAEQPVEDDKLSWLLKFLTVHNSTGFEDGRIVIQLNDQIVQYDPRNEKLNPSESAFPDLRMYPAPIHLYLLSQAEEENESESLWIWRGYAGQRIYLGVSALGLGTVTIRGIGFPIGYPAEPMTWSTYESFRIGLPDRLNTQLENTLLPPADENLESITKESLHALLWSAYGLSYLQDAKGKVHRTVPSARGKYPMRVMAITPEGIFQYIPDSIACRLARSENLIPKIHEWLNPGDFRDASHFLVLIWNRTVLESKAFAWYEAGASLANLQLTANALNHQLFRVGLATSDSLSALLEINNDMEEVLLVVGIQGGLSKKSSAEWKDGIYTGATKSWPAMEVEVTVREGRIQNLQILHNNSTPEFSTQVLASLPDKIIQANNTEVDGVSGATLSSNSLKKAVQNALENAK